MAEGEGKSFENPTYDQYPWEDDDYGDETIPFLPNGHLRQLLANTRNK